METDYTNAEENVYFACRKRAAVYNEKLNSRENAAELLGISPSTLANHELGITKNVPVDTVVMMADLYHAPELKNRYCKGECPIGKYMPLAVKAESLQGTVIRILDSLDDEEIRKLKRLLVSVGAAETLGGAEREQLGQAIEVADKISLVFSELRMQAENLMNEEG